MADAGAAGLGHGLTVGVVVPRLEVAHERFVVTDRHHGVQVRESPLQLIAFLGDDAAGNRDRSQRRLPLFELVELGVDPIFGGLADDARVEDRDVGAIERVLGVAGGEQPSGEALGIRGVHLATDRPDVERPGLNRRYLLSTRSRIPVRSSPSIEMSMKAGMQTRSSPPGAT